MVRHLLGFGYKGSLVFIGNTAEVRAEDERIRKEGREHPLLSPLAEVSLAGTAFPNPETLYVPRSDPGYVMLKAWLAPIYAAHARYGAFGDVLDVLEFGPWYTLVSIAPKAFHKPGIATDLLPVFIDGAGHRYLLAILRGREPAKGRVAFIGGFNDIEGFSFHSSPQTFVHEAEEEAGLALTLPGTFYVPFPPHVEVSAAVLEHGTLRATAYALGAFYTGEEEEERSLGQKRVHVAVAYLLPISVPYRISPAEFARSFAPTDAAEGNKVVVLDMQGPIPFGFSHHYLMHAHALKKLAELEARGRI